MTKPTKWHVRPAKTRISLGIRPVWSESSLSAWRKLSSLVIHWAQSEDPDQTGRMPRLIWVFAGRTCHFVGFIMRRLIWHVTSVIFVVLAKLSVAVYRLKRRIIICLFLDINSSSIITSSSPDSSNWVTDMKISKRIDLGKIEGLENFNINVWSLTVFICAIREYVITYKQICLHFQHIGSCERINLRTWVKSTVVFLIKERKTGEDHYGTPEETFSFLFLSCAHKLLTRFNNIMTRLNDL